MASSMLWTKVSEVRMLRSRGEASDKAGEVDWG